MQGLGADVAKIAGASDHSCAIMDTGEARCWGWNQSGQVSNWSFLSLVTAPVPVTGHATGTLAIAAINGKSFDMTASLRVLARGTRRMT
ncbi:MAG: RCC1 domain-containing protein [Thermoflexales bacterium]